MLNPTAPTPYPSYSSSGVEWLGDVPEHWELGHLRYFAESLDGARIPLSKEQRGTMQGSIPYWGANSVIDHVDNWIFNEPIVLVGEDGAPFQDPSRPVAFFVNEKVWVNNHIHVLRCNNQLNPKFFTHVLNSVDYANFISGSTRDKLTQQDLGNIPIQIPPTSEQRAIVRYLDYVDRRVRRYVGAKRRLIALLEEEKQAVVNRAVTRGLNPDVRLKPSGIEWLGEVPDHWGVRRAKFFYREADERSTTGTEELMSVSHITGVTPRKKSVTMFLAESNMGYKLCRPGDIVINTMWAYMAALGVARQTGLVSPSYGVYRPLSTERLNHDYVDSLLRTEAYRTNYLIRSTGITSSRLRLYPESFLDVPLICPPRNEQDAIIEHLVRETAATAAAIGRARRQIELVQEYRTRLIADVVTGKLDVREVAAQLPEEAEDEEPIDENGFVADNEDDGAFDLKGVPEEELAAESEVGE